MARNAYIQKALRRVRDFHSLDGIGQPLSVDTLSFQRACILAPHPDDETIGMGGFLSQYSGQVDVCCVTDGGLGILAKNRDETASIREREFCAAMEFFGISTYRLLAGLDGLMAANRRQLETVRWDTYDLIALPNWLDSHRDHVGLSQIIFELAADGKIHKNTKILFYEVWSTLSLPTHYLDLTQSLHKKISAINIYESQLKEINYAKTQFQLAYFRGQMCGVDAAETYTVITAADLVRLW